MKDRPSSGKRPYRMTARARAAAETGQRIIDAAEALFRERPYAEVTLEAIAERAGVSAQTVIRRYGSKDGLFRAATEQKAEEVLAARTPPVPDDRGAAIRTLVASYEEMGDLSWRALCQEEEFSTIRRMLERARASHRMWIERCFASLLPPEPGPQRERRITLLFAATDFYLWKLMRRDLGLDRAATTRALRDLVEALGQAFSSLPPSPEQPRKEAG